MMNESDQTQPGSLARQAIGKGRQGEPVDDSRPAIGQSPQRLSGGSARRSVDIGITPRQFDDSHRASRGPQTLHHLAIEEITAGDLIEGARNEERQAHQLNEAMGAS